MFINDGPKPGRADRGDFVLTDEGAVTWLSCGWSFHIAAAYPAVHGVTANPRDAVALGRIGWTSVNGHIVGVGEELALPDEGLIGRFERGGHAAWHPEISALAHWKVIHQFAIVICGVHLG